MDLIKKLRRDGADIGENVTIGEGCKIDVSELKIGDGAVIGKNTTMKALKVEIGKAVRIGPNFQLEVTSEFMVGERSDLIENCRMMGGKIHLGKKLWAMGTFIGGGGWRDPQSELEIGDFCHLGEETHINICRKVSIGDEVGIGFRSYIVTHGAWANALEGYPCSFAPVTIKDYAWLPTSVGVMPGVTIGRGAVIGSGAVVTKDVPDYCFAAGIPARVVKTRETFLPKLSMEQKFGIAKRVFQEFKVHIAKRLDRESEIELGADGLLARLKMEGNSIVIGISSDKGSLSKIDLLKREVTGVRTGLGVEIIDFYRRRGVRIITERYAPE